MHRRLFRSCLTTKWTVFLASAGLAPETSRLGPQTWLIRCPGEHAIASVLEICTSEAIVFMTDNNVRSAHNTLIAVDEYAGDYQGHETPFMTRLDVHGGFFFFAETHQSIEVLGTPGFIWRRCLTWMVEEAVNMFPPR